MAENTPAVTAKRTVPGFAERVSAAPPSRGDPPRGDLLAVGKDSCPRVSHSILDPAGVF